MEPEVGAVVEGKISGIAKFGAFVSLPGGKSGLVHISELTKGYVDKVEDCVRIGQIVKVKVLNVSPDGKINLSLKQAAEDYTPGPEGAEGVGTGYSAKRNSVSAQGADSRQPRYAAAQQAADGKSDNREFEDRLKKFMQDSDRRIADNPVYSQHKQKNRKR